MKKILSLIAFLLIALIGYSQTSPLSFTKLSGDFVAPGKGFYHWNDAQWDGVNNPTIPSGNSNSINYYYRFNWLDIESNTVQGSYDFTLFDTKFNAAIDAGAMFDFGVMAFCSGCGSQGVVPLYVQNLMTTEGKPCWNNGGTITPNYQSTNWSKRYCAMLRAIANHIAVTSRNGHSYTSALWGFNLRHYGDFGEGNGYPSPSVAPTSAQVTDTYLSAMVDSAIAIYPNVQLDVQMSYIAPNNDYNNADGNTGTAAAYHCLTASNNFGRISWRRDNIGDDGFNAYLTGTTATFNPGTGPVPLLPLIMNAWKTGPVGGEPANDFCGTSRCGSIQCDLHDEDTLFHMNQCGNGNFPILVTDNSTQTCGSTTYLHSGDSLISHTRAGSAEQGYRLVLDTGLVTTSPLTGGPFQIVLNWKNIGLDPVYEKWNVTYELRNGSTVVWTGGSVFSPRLFLPASSDSVVSDNFVLTGVTPGTYNLYLIIRDPLGFKAPLPLGITGRNADGSYLLKSSLVVQDINTLIVIWGESNAAGNADNSAAPSNQLGVRPKVQILDHNLSKFNPLNIGGNNEQNTFISSPDSPTTKHGFELAMANEIDTGKLRNPTYTVKIGVSGAYICQWLKEDGDSCRPTGNLWDGWIGFVDSAVAKIQALGKPYRIVVWQSIGLNDLYQQGTTESNFFNGMALFRSDFRARYHDSTIVFYGTNFNNPGVQDYAWGFLLDSMAKVDKYYHSIPVVGSTYIDAGVHWDYAGFKLIVTNIVDSMNAAPVPPATVTAFAGPDQSFSLPTSSTTLDGSGSSGLITTYAWTKVSGPNTPTIVSPSSAITSVTGLIQGTYTFQLSVNGGASTDQMNVTVNSPVSGTINIFTTQTPVAGTSNDNPPNCCNTSTGQENGLKFRSSVNAMVTGVRFYKTAGNTGTHIGELYTNTGTRLAAATFTGETATGWQSVSFSSPVAITANTTYMVAYFSSLGNYVEDLNYFAGTSVTNAPLTALADGTDGPNAPATYSGVPVFPVDYFHQSNYWVDVNVFIPHQTFIIGTGSGAVSLTSMSGHNPGDTAFIATPTGTYTSLTLQNLNGIVVRPQTIRPTFTTQSSMCNLNNVDVGFLNFMSAGDANAIDMTCGTVDSSTFHNLYFQGWFGECFNQSGNLVYTYGNNATYKQFRVIYDSLYIYQCGSPFQGSFAYMNASPKVDVARELTLSRIVDQATSRTNQEGIGYEGMCFHCTAHDIQITSITQRDPNGDNGWLFGSGWWHAWNIYKWGSPGYLIRNFGLTEYQDPGNTWIVNSAKFNSTGYGLANYEFNSADTSTGQFRGISDTTMNCTLGNQEEPAILGAFWAPVVNGGQVPPGGHHIVKNNFGFNIGFPVNNNGKPFIAVNEGGWTNYATDTSNNQYLLTATVAKLDSVTTLFTNRIGSFPGYFITTSTGGIVLHGGLTNQFRTVDYLGNAMRVPPDLGYIQFNGNTPPPFPGITNLHNGFKKLLLTR